MDRLKHVFASVLGIPPESITDTLSPENTPSWDSLNAIVLITEIERAFGIRFGFAEAMAVKNFKDAVELVRSKAPNLT